MKTPNFQKMQKPSPPPEYKEPEVYTIYQYANAKDYWVKNSAGKWEYKNPNK
jgi:hypothetical protein